jgi:hypothetical protein
MDVELHCSPTYDQKSIYLSYMALRISPFSKISALIVCSLMTTSQRWSVIYKRDLRIQELNRLDIIPLRDGLWVSSNSGEIFYPEYNKIAVPKDLGMRLVDPTATKNVPRCAFFDNL